MNAVQIAALALFIVSLLPLSICFIKIYLLKKYRSKAIVTTATVISAEERRGFKNAPYYFLHIKYNIENGIEYTAQTISWKKYATGDNMPLMYLQHDPGNFKTDLGQSLKWLLPISIMLIAGVGWFCYWLLHMKYTSVS